MPVRNLSGGNQQRLVARREMRIADTVLIAAYPSRGLDVGAINTMMRYFVELRDQGVGVILISEELEELMNLSDRIAVMFHGEIMGVVKTAATNIEAIGLLMGGQRQAAASSICPRRSRPSPCWHAPWRSCSRCAAPACSWPSTAPRRCNWPRR